MWRVYEVYVLHSRCILAFFLVECNLNRSLRFSIYSLSGDEASCTDLLSHFLCITLTSVYPEMLHLHCDWTHTMKPTLFQCFSACLLPFFSPPWVHPMPLNLALSFLSFLSRGMPTLQLQGYAKTSDCDTL